MPGGSTAEKNLIPEPQQESPDETADLLAAEKAKSAADLRTAAANDNYNPYTEGSTNDNNIPAETSPEAESSFSPVEEERFQKGDQREQLDAQQQAEAAASLAGNKQRQLLQIAKERQAAEEQLGELEKNLTNFKTSKLGGLSSIFQPKIKLLIDTILEEMKKGARNLADEQKVGYYTGLIVTVSSLIGILTALKMVAAVLDATFSWLTKAIPSCVTCVGCIVLILIAPIYILFFALIFMLGTIPLMKGRLTKIDADLIKDLKKQRTAWQAELDVIKKKVILRKQIKALTKTEKQVKRAK